MDRNTQKGMPCGTRGESEDFVVCRAQRMRARGSTLALKPRADIRSPNRGIRGPTKGLIEVFRNKHFRNRMYHHLNFLDNGCLRALMNVRMYTLQYISMKAKSGRKTIVFQFKKWLATI